MSIVMVLPHICVLNANAHSSPYTVGFPAMTAWLGAAHFLQREIVQNENMKLVKCEGVGIVCHDFTMHSYRDREKYVASLIGTSNPLDKKGDRPSFIEEAKCSLEVSLIIQISGLDLMYRNDFINLVNGILIGRMKIASGDVMKAGKPRLENADTESLPRLMGSLMPGYVLVERRKLMVDALKENPQADAMDVVLDYLKVHNTCSQADDVVEWSQNRKGMGWIVPISVGYQAITGFVDSPGQRDTSVPHRFVESVVTLGEFKMVYRIRKLDDMLWHYHVTADNELYVCRNEKLIEGDE
ncbi:type I-F CRISPR-associated protein Csy2 [Parasphaerochaeta coccoides]|uniref:CRISPR-associated protein, Csy2 family n=1 Tax=Parasphaerochaeta coccoides (strain ATCC BAA-1237 / DSM 17374 / SPN1) TaxID=760011 RepID=F4GL28_PARC1|nr:type I-F CRISPR-associated protein Csy2 [Parasphaerochaeta coccoides]AEC02368.1 CRISPR-associated protein, Csy2 family [Parasphaerochaeta coccoides DSM 17374]